MEEDDDGTRLYPRDVVERRASAHRRILPRHDSFASMDSPPGLRPPGLSRQGSKMTSSLSSRSSTSFSKIASIAEKAALFEDLLEIEDDKVAQKMTRAATNATLEGAHSKRRVDEKLITMVNNPNMKGILQFATAHTTKLAAKNGVSAHILKTVLVEDEMLLHSCIEMPATMVGISVFMIFFQQHYLTSFVYLQETNIRDHVTNKAFEASNIEDIYTWLEQDFLPFLWSANRDLQNSLSTDIEGARYDLLGGFLIRIQRSSVEPCKDATVSQYECQSVTGNNPDAINTSGAFLHKDDALDSVSGWYMQEGRRLRSTETSSLDFAEAAVAYLTQWLPGATSSMQVGHRDDPVATTRDRRQISQQHITRRQGSQTARYCSRTRCSRTRLRRQEQRHGKGWHPMRVARRLIDPMGDMGGYHKVHKQSERGRRLRITRPEYGMGGWIPNPRVQKDVWEYVVPMSTPQEEVERLIRTWKRNQIIDRSTLFFGVEALLRNDAIGNGLASHAFVNFIFSRGGHIYVDVKFASLVLSDHIWVLGLGAIWVVGRVWNSVFTPMRALRAWRKGKLQTHLSRFPNWIEWLLISHAWFLMIVFTIERLGVRRINTDFNTYKEERQRFLSEDTGDLWNFDVAWFKKMHANFLVTGITDSWLHQIVATYHLFLVIRFMVATRGQRRLALVVKTVRLAAFDLMHLAIVFLVVALAYIFSGHLLFGSRDERFATLEGSVGITLKIVFERQFDFQMMTEEDFFTCTFWVFSFVIVTCLVLVNITLGIVIYMYEEYRIYIREHDSVTATVSRVYNEVVSPWAASNEVLEAIRRIAKSDSTRISAVELCKELPKMCEEQVQWIFAKSAEKVTAIQTTNRLDNEAHLLVAPLVVYVLQLQRAVRLMARGRTLARTNTQPMTFTYTRTGTQEVSLPSNDVAEGSFKHLDEDGQPRWLTESLIPFLSAQEEKLDQLHRKIEQVGGRIQERGLIDESRNFNPMPCARPDYPLDGQNASPRFACGVANSSSGLPSYECFSPLGQHAPRQATRKAQKLIEKMPGSPMLASPGLQLEEARVRGQVLQALSSSVHASVQKERPMLIDL